MGGVLELEHAVVSDESAAAAEAPTSEADATVEATAAATPANGAPETAAQARARYKVGDEDLDADQVLERIVGAVGPEGLSNISGLASLVRRQMSETGRTKAEIQQAVADLRDPRRRGAVLERLAGGRDQLRAWTEEWYAEDLEERGKSPEEREKGKVQTELQQLKAERDAIAKEKAERERVQLASKMELDFGRDFTAALRAVGEIADGDMLAEMSKYVEAELNDLRGEGDYRAVVEEAARAVARKFGEGTAARFPKLAKDKRIAAVRAELAAMSYEELRDALGDEGARKFNAGEVARLKSRTAGAVAANGAPPRASNGAKREKIPLDEYFKSLSRTGDKI